MKINRREFNRILGLAGSQLLVPGMALAKVKGQKSESLKGPQQSGKPTLKSKPTLLMKPIPSTGELIPAIGMGTWISFNVGKNKKLRADRTQVLQTFFEMGGGMVDSSPMYGAAQEVMGHALNNLNYPKGLFSADKIWTGSTSEGPEQFSDMKKLWGLKKFDLLQIHNLLNWQDHLKFLQKLKAEGNIKYLGITTSHGRRHSELEDIMKQHKLDFVQLTYNITHRDVENRLLKVAQDRGIAIIANRPYDGGNLMRSYKSKPLPGVAKDAGIQSWADLFLNWIVSHPAVTVAIPATSKTLHMKENMGVLRSQLLDQKLRKELAKVII